MRLGEIRALQVDSLKHDSEGQPFILVSQSWEEGSGLKGTKTNESRCILIPAELNEQLIGLVSSRKDGFVLSLDDGETPLSSKELPQGLYRALKEIGIDESQRKERNITFHSWRHFANTTYRALGVPDVKVQSMTGHSSQAMTEHYSHFRTSDFAEVRQAQMKLVKDWHNQARLSLNNLLENPQPIRAVWSRQYRP